MKKVWTIILIALLAIALAVLILVRFLPAESYESVDMDSPYPCTVQETKKGLEVTVTGKFPAECKWTGEILSGYAADITELKQTDRKASFLITPVSWGSASAVLSLEKTANGIPERVYELDFDVSVGSDRSLSLLGADCREPESISGETEHYYYRAASASDGSLDLYIGGSSVYEWMLQVDGDCAAGQEPEITEETGDFARFRLVYLKPGTGTVRLCSTTADEAVEIEIEADAEGRLHPGAHQAVPYQYTKPDAAAECAAAYAQLLGAPALPREAELLSANAMLWISRADPARCLDVGCLEFEMDGMTWLLYGSDTATAADLFVDRSAEALSQQTVRTDDGKTAIVYDHADGAFAGWKSAAGRSWLLEAEDGAGAEDVVSAVEKLLKVAA